jgi:phage pi2 protein 07
MVQTNLGILSKRRLKRSWIIGGWEYYPDDKYNKFELLRLGMLSVVLNMLKFSDIISKTVQ